MSPEAIGSFIEAGDSIYTHRADELFSKKETEVAVQAVSAAPKQTARNSRSTRSKSVTVRAGDTLGAIARRNHTTVDRLKRMNGLRGSTIRSGQRIRVR